MKSCRIMIEEIKSAQTELLKTSLEKNFNSTLYYEHSSNYRINYTSTDNQITIAEYLDETIDITKDCKCFSCLTGYKRSYLHHLFKCKELNGPIIVNIHNYFQTRELYEKLSEYKNDIDK